MAYIKNETDNKICHGLVNAFIKNNAQSEIKYFDAK